MVATTIQVSDETRELLKRYKVAGMSYEEVLRLFMELLSPEEFHSLYRDWQSKVAKEVRKSKKWDALSLGS
ncbi:MAG: hypothetical protein KY455_04330 [Euryarchaeota archaeon]|nr:hypothetical protein [Euryarchaeota archaeon]